MKKLVAVTSSRSVGATFVDWSILFLSGQSHFYNIAEDKMLPISMNPIEITNSHGHKKNHASTNIDLYEYTEKLLVGTEGITTFYPYSSLGNLDSNSSHIFEEINRVANDKWKHFTDFLYRKNIDLVYLDYRLSPLYFTTMRAPVLSSKDHTNVIYTADQRNNELIDLFFKDTFTDIKEPWDIRERWALAGRNTMFSTHPIEIITTPHHRVQAVNLWFDGEYEIRRIMNYLNIPIDEERMNLWITIHLSWAQAQAKSMKFAWDLDMIVECIVHNIPLDISHYNLDIWQEGAILSDLIYKHNLNIRGYGLEKFPNNTQEIHTLLEENFHPKESKII